MDKIRNPFSPGAGSPPPELVGRDGVLEQAHVLLGRVKQKRPEKSLVLTGLRGVGKTVLLNQINRIAQDKNYHTLFVEAHEGKKLAELLSTRLRSLLFDLDRIKGAGDKVKKGLSVLKNFLSGLKVSYGDFSLDIEPERGRADSGDLELDLPDLLVSVAEAAEERGTAVAILIDELQYFSPKELSALIMAMHQMQQRQLPLVFVGAGLPILPGMAGESKSYAERLFDFPDIGPLSESDVAKALNDPVKTMGIKFETSALKEIYTLTKGYPYFIQEWGYQSWNHAETSPITLDVTRRVSPSVLNRLDQNFFRVRYDRLTGRERDYLRAMAQMGPGSHRTSDIADLLGAKPSALGPLRDGLIKRGMIYSPAYGDIAFTVPLFDRFMRRVIPDFHPETRKKRTPTKKRFV